MPDRTAFARAIADAMAPHALPDCRFGLDFGAFIPGFAAAGTAAGRLLDAVALAEGSAVFITPDNGLQPLRAMLLERGVRLVLPTYGLMRGFLAVGGTPMAPEAALARSWLEGAEHYGRLVGLGDIAALGPITHVVTAAAAISRNGVRFGMGAHYLDIEYPLLAEAGALAPGAPVHAIVHDAQLHDDAVAPAPSEVRAATIATPTRFLVTGSVVYPDRLDIAALDPVWLGAAPVRELLAARTKG